VGTAFLDRPDPANAPRTMRYSDFVEAVQANDVSRVLISPDRGTAQVVENDGRRAVVNLAPDKDLLKILNDHKAPNTTQRDFLGRKAKEGNVGIKQNSTPSHSSFPFCPSLPGFTTPNT
jgi:ATP-dependent Zn protease